MFNVVKFVSEVGAERFSEYYYTHNNKDVCREFSIKKCQINKVLSFLNLSKKTKEQINAIISGTLLDKADEDKQRSKSKRIETCLSRYGVESSSSSDEVRSKISKTINSMSDEEKSLKVKRFHETMSNKTADDILEWKKKLSDATKSHFANMTDEERLKFSNRMSEWYNNLSDDVKISRVKKGIQTKIDKYGVRYQSDNYKKHRNKIVETNMEKYGVPYYCMTEKCRSALGGNASNSKPNLKFKALLESNGIEFSREFHLENFSYDFKVGNTLIEINPTATHNSTWSPFGDPLDMNYHLDKKKCAVRNGFNLICVWDWDDLYKVISIIAQKEKIFARKCCIKELEDVDDFLNSYHLQGSCKGQSIKIGLFYNDELVEVMTFGKPRYNKNYEYELLRLCTKSNVEVIGGSSKIFNYFLKTYKPESIISYCDDSKFTGNIYSILGFVKGKEAIPSLHWYNPTSRSHITDNLLRKQGFDRLVGRYIGESFGKNTDNSELMIEHGFVEIYDCGQSSYIYKKHI